MEQTSEWLFRFLTVIVERLLLLFFIEGNLRPGFIDQSVKQLSDYFLDLSLGIESFSRLNFICCVSDLASFHALLLHCCVLFPWVLLIRLNFIDEAIKQKVILVFIHIHKFASIFV